MFLKSIVTSLNRFKQMILIDTTAFSILRKLQEMYGGGFFLLIATADAISKVNLATWLIFIHVLYYNIAHRITILTSLIDNNILGSTIILSNLKVSFASALSGKQPSDECLHRVGYLFHLLAKTSSQLQSAFSLPAFLVITTSFFSCTVNLFLLVDELFKSPLFSQSLFLHVILVASHIILPFTIILSVDLPIKEVQ